MSHKQLHPDITELTQDRVISDRSTKWSGVLHILCAAILPCTAQSVTLLVDKSSNVQDQLQHHLDLFQFMLLLHGVDIWS